jgi:CHAD domain-containing protein
MAVHAQPSSPVRPSGIAYWMGRVLNGLDKALPDFAAEPVHDLRVALRRCRSMAEGFRDIDPLPAWKKMRRAGKEIFAPLGELRDTQVLLDWIKRLGAPGDPAAQAMLAFLGSREQQQKLQLAETLAHFDRKQWQHWSRTLGARAARVTASGLVFEYLALERWTAAHDLHRRALRNRSQAAFHQLRIGLKKLRYLTENFLPVLHQRWGGNLKKLQDVLGEVHDLDILWQTAQASGAFANDASRAEWRTRILQERRQRIDAYRKKMIGPESLWPRWRAELPQGENLQKAITGRFEIMVRLLDADLPQARRIARTAVRLYDGLLRTGLLAHSAGKTSGASPEPRAVLYIAGLLHSISHSKRKKISAKASASKLQKLTIPVGWQRSDVQIIVAVVPSHGGASRGKNDNTSQALSPAEAEVAREFAAVIRLSEALHHCNVSGALKIEKTVETLRLHFMGQCSDEADEEKIASAKFSLEKIIGRPIVVAVRGSSARKRKTA